MPFVDTMDIANGTCPNCCSSEIDYGDFDFLGDHVTLEACCSACGLRVNLLYHLHNATVLQWPAQEEGDAD